MTDFFNAPADDSHSFVSEENVVKAILKQGNASAVFKTLLKECEEDTGIKHINLSWFLNKYQAFPIWLGIRKVEFQRDVFGELHKKFTKTPCFKAWEEVNESKPEGEERGSGCVFTWPRFGVCCIHQYSSTYLADSDGIWIAKKLPSFDDRFVIEPLNQLISAIDWQFPEFR